MNKKIVISGSSRLQDKINYWINHFNKMSYIILDYPKYITQEDYEKNLPKAFEDYYNNLEKTDFYFLMNEDKNEIKGYIGASSFSELTYVVIQNLIHKKNIEIYILKMPSTEVSSYNEISFYLKMGWIKLYENKI